MTSKNFDYNNNNASISTLASLSTRTTTTTTTKTTNSYLGSTSISLSTSNTKSNATSRHKKVKKKVIRKKKYLPKSQLKSNGDQTNNINNANAHSIQTQEQLITDRIEFLQSGYLQTILPELVEKLHAINQKLKIRTFSSEEINDMKQLQDTRRELMMKIERYKTGFYLRKFKENLEKHHLGEFLRYDSDLNSQLDQKNQVENDDEENLKKDDSIANAKSILPVINNSNSINFEELLNNSNKYHYHQSESGSRFGLGLLDSTFAKTSDSGLDNQNISGYQLRRQQKTLNVSQTDHKVNYDNIKKVREMKIDDSIFLDEDEHENGPIDENIEPDEQRYNIEDGQIMMNLTNDGNNDHDNNDEFNGVMDNNIIEENKNDNEQQQQQHQHQQQQQQHIPKFFGYELNQLNLNTNRNKKNGSFDIRNSILPPLPSLSSKTTPKFENKTETETETENIVCNNDDDFFDSPTAIFTQVMNSQKNSRNRGDNTHNTQKTEISNKNKSKEINQENIFDQDEEELCSVESFMNIKPKLANTQICSACQIPFEQDEEAGTWICSRCSIVIPFIDTSNNTGQLFNAPKPHNQFTKHIQAFAKFLKKFDPVPWIIIETEVKQEIIDYVQMQRSGMPTDEITSLEIDTVLKKKKRNEYYEHGIQIFSELNCIAVPTMTKEINERFQQFFKKLENPWDAHRGTRTKFFTPAFIFIKICRILKYTEFIPFMDVVKSTKNSFVQELIWEKMCIDLECIYIRDYFEEKS